MIGSSGDVDRPFYIRSSAKPFQATASQEAGADLTPLEMALSCASHRGFPVHVAVVSSMLGVAGLDESALQCPPSWPLASEASRLVVRQGGSEPRRVWHNCSGKHAGFLRACVAAGWPTGSYLSPDHPLQRRVAALVSEMGEYQVEPVGVDGCGAPVLRTTVRAMALMFAKLATERRLEHARAAMHRYPAMIAANGEGDTEIAIALDGVAKGGAAGCVGVGLRDRLGLAVKSWDGLGAVANVGAVAALDQIGALTTTALTALESTLRPPVFGGGRLVGHLESRLMLDLT